MLGVHVLGPGFGESIIIELPGGEVGVIDSFIAIRVHRFLTGLLHHHRKSMNIKELRIRTCVNASGCPARSYAQSVAPGAVSSLL